MTTRELGEIGRELLEREGAVSAAASRSSSAPDGAHSWSSISILG